MKVQKTIFKINQDSMRFIEKNTKLTADEMRNLSLQDTRDLMVKRGAIKKPNPFKEFFTKLYKNFGEKYGLLKKEHHFYTDID